MFGILKSMRALISLLIIMTSCSHTKMAPIALFSSYSVKPIVAVGPMINHENTPIFEEVAAIFTQTVLERIKQKDKILIGTKHPEFSVTMKLVGHEILPLNPSELSMQIHLEILDLREEKPKVILQEVLSLIARINEGQPIAISWKNPAFRMSPLGLAHRKLSREIAMRIEDYILLAKKGNH